MGKKQLKYWGGLTNNEIQRRIERVLQYCEPHLDQMWAASIVGTLLSGDFRDAKEWLNEYRRLDLEKIDALEYRKPDSPIESKK